MVNQNKIITEKTAVSDTAKVKANQLLALYRDARIKYKESQLLQREMLAQIKMKHTEILDNEDRQRQLTTLLKERKERGMSPNTCKRIEQQKVEKAKDALFKAKQEYSQAEEARKQTLE